LLVLTVEQLAVALALVLGGAILMLLVGTQILDWYWLVLLAAVGIGFSLARIRARRVNEYRVAQILDRRLALSDTLSTAWFLLTNRVAPQDRLAELHLERAEELARTVSPTHAFPFSGGRAWAITGILATAAFSLFAFRYLVTNSLSLRASLVPLQLGSVFERVDKTTLAEQRRPEDSLSSDHQNVRLSQTNDLQRDGRNEQQQAEEMKSGRPDDTSSLGRETRSSDKPPTNALQQSKGQNRESGDARAQATGDEKSQPESANQTSDGKPANTQEQSEQRQQNSGLMDRMKDAISNLMSKMKSNGNAQKSAQNSDKPGDDQKGGDQTGKNAEHQGQPQQSSANQQSTQEQSAQGQAQGQTAEKAQAAQGQSSSDSADKKTNDSHSGVGRQDGDKAIREAEQLKAMGKLAEIIGKRSASLTGEMMVETPNNKQQLKTEYSQHVGQHADLGGEINRDEVPLMYRQYVREYMEQVRKQGKAR
jgi:hypothetical protein